MSTKKNQNLNILLPAKKAEAHGLALTGIREIVSRETGETNYVLCFGREAEVVMPGSWNLREDQFPNGLYEGMKLDAYWAPDAEGVNRFHLEEV